MKGKSLSLKTVVFILHWGIALAVSIEAHTWYPAAIFTVYLGILFFRAVPDKLIALRMWACYIAHVLTGVYLMERAVLFFWVMATSIFVCDTYQQLTGEHIVSLFNMSIAGRITEEIEDEN